jgi:hypothetical protein
MADESAEQLKKQIDVLEKKLALYENHGGVRLYYALNKKQNEMADMLNATNLKILPLDDPKDKTFERIRFIINDSSGLAAAIKSLGESVGITGDEEKDKRRKVPFMETIADKRT